MPSKKADLSSKISELNAIANNLPEGNCKIAIQSMTNKLGTVVNTALQDDGSTHPAAAGLGGLPSALSDGDGHAVTCC